jgi:hypothetical protein
MKKLVIAVTLLVITFVLSMAVFYTAPAPTPKVNTSIAQFNPGDLVYICNEDRSDPTPLCITNEASKVLEVRWSDDRNCYQYRIKVYAKENTGWDAKWWVKEKYIHKW